VGSERFDLELFEQLDREWATRPDRKPPVPRDERSMREKASRRLETIARQLGGDLAGKVVLELGCGHGWLTAYVPAAWDAARAIGVDVRRYPAWERHDDPRVRLLVADLAQDRVVEPESVDVVISGAVLEHVSRPIEMLEAVYELLRPGGRAWLYFNLHRGSQASHRYNEVSFPWPHLLFEDAVCAAFYDKHHGTPREFAWVNRMTLAEYVQAVDEIGFRIHSVKRRVTPIDVGFYRRFEGVLGRYPALDLETDFATLVLEKAPPGELPRLGYAEAQRSLTEAIAAAGAAPAVA
jgi:SAM-dependent methyltransferase